MKIESVQAAVLRNPGALAPPGVTPPNGAPWAAFDYHPVDLAPPWGDLACVVTAADGTWGFGATTFAVPAASIVNDHLGPLLAGRKLVDVASIERHWDTMDRACGAHFGTAGLASYAISAVDLALWDLLGKLEGAPVYELLGGKLRDRVPTYATGTAPGAYLDLGHQAVKLPCMWRGSSPGSDLERSIADTVAFASQTRDLLGDDRDLMLDGWSVLDVDAAVALGRALEPLAPRWLEDTVFPEDWPGYVRLRQELPGVPLAAGERWYTPRPFVAMAEAHAVDVFQPDPLWVGGATAVRRIAQVVEEAGAELALHCGGNDPFGQHLSVALPGVEIAEVYFGQEPTGPIPSYRAYAGTAVSVDGHIGATAAPGFGFELTLDDIEAAT